jgi:hypothetical protein
MPQQPTMRRVKGPGDVPEGPHYAVLIYDKKSVHIPGDERSRTNPGHGYPEHTEEFDSFEHWVTNDNSFESQKALDDFVLALKLEDPAPYSRKKRAFVVLKVEKKAQILTKTSIEF